MVDSLPDDDYLVRAAQGGDVRAFEGLVRRHGPRAHRVAVRMLGSADDAQDATQDAFVKAWLDLDRFRSESAFGTWLYRIVVNVCLNRLRGQRRTEPLPDTLTDVLPGPHRVVETGSQVEQLMKEILRLTPDQRAPIVLREIEGCSYEEIADILGLTVAAVRGRLHRARAELAKAMRGWT
jgi:RNA polymerase sigma-70 factor (ECF subfamily)